MRRVIIGVVLLVLAALALATYLTLDWYHSGLEPADPAARTKLVRIPEGSSVSQIARILHDEALIRDERAFRLMLRLKGLAGELRAGVYDISPGMSAEEIARHIASGRVAMRRLTIPEGFRLDQIAERVAEAELADAEEFRRAAVGKSVAEALSMPVPEGGLEGYLFPETYDFCCDLPPEAIVTRMVREFEERFYLPHRAEIEARGLSLHQIITLASLVEREARVAEERALIAGVIQNRLDRGMKLQIDATVQYALPQHKERLLFEDLRVDSPYNTYRHNGLPPGPIASPGLPSLLAALRPAETEALFYVARSDGTHIFTPSYEQHRRAIESVRGR